MKKIAIFFLFILVFLTFPLLSPGRGNQDGFGPFEAAASEESPDSLPGPEAGIIRLGVDAADAGTLDPHFAAGIQDRPLADMVFNGLVRYIPGKAPRLEPDLAVSIPEPQMDHGKQIWTFRLKKGVMFHPGPANEPYELTAEDVVFSFRKAANPALSAYSGEYIGLTVSQVDDYTVRLVLDKPLSPMLFLPKVANYAGGFIVSHRAIRDGGLELFKKHPVGTGPFMFESYTPGQKISLKAHQRYFRGCPALAGVDLCFVSAQEKREKALLEGQLDVVENPRIEIMANRKGITLDQRVGGEVVMIHFNTSDGPTSDVQVRRAIAHALDRSVFRSCFSRHVIQNVYSPVPANILPGGLNRSEVKPLGLDYAADPDLARTMLAQAGYEHGLTLSLISSPMPIYLKTYNSLAGQLAKVGIDCHIRVVDHAVMHQAIRRENYPLVVYVAWRPNADVFLTRFFHSDSLVVSGAKPDTNFSRYKGIDNLIEGARLETNPGYQIKLWKQAQVKLLSDMVVYPIMYAGLVYARRDYVDYGHEVKSSMALYPQITEKTCIVDRNRPVEGN